MFLANDLKSRLKGLRHAHLGEPEKVPHPGLVAWTVLLLLAATTLVIVAVVSYYRFSYWKDIDARLVEQSGAVTYDAAKLEGILEDFEDKSERSLEILMAMPVMEIETATSTATSSPVLNEE